MNGLVVHTPPVRSSDCPDVLQNLQNAPSQSASYFNHGKSFSHLFIFPAAATCSTILQSLLQKFRFTNTGFLVGGASISSSLLLSLLLLLEGTNVDGLLELPK